MSRKEKLVSSGCLLTMTNSKAPFTLAKFGPIERLISAHFLTPLSSKCFTLTQNYIFANAERPKEALAEA